MDDENGVADTSTQQEETVLETVEAETEEQDSEESVEDYKARLAKAEKLANNYKIRAEKAEKAVKRPVEQKTESRQSGELGTKDLYALMEAKVAQEDVDEVVEYAKFKNISVSEALKSSVVKTLLSDKAEQRATAEAANVGSSKRSSGKVPDDVLLAKASKGELPDNDADMERLIRLRKGLK